MKLTDSYGYDDSYPRSELKRVFYNIELEEGIYVDIMVSEECHTVYAMQNEDGSTAYGEELLPGYAYDEEAAKALAVTAYEKEYGPVSWYKG